MKFKVNLSRGMIRNFCIFSQTVFDKFGAVIKMLDSGDKIKVDQAHLETVIPALG